MFQAGARSVTICRSVPAFSGGTPRMLIATFSASSNVFGSVVVDRGKSDALLSRVHPSICSATCCASATKAS